MSHVGIMSQMFKFEQVHYLVHVSFTSKPHNANMTHNTHTYFTFVVAGKHMESTENSTLCLRLRGVVWRTISEIKGNFYRVSIRKGGGGRRRKAN